MTHTITTYFKEKYIGFHKIIRIGIIRIICIGVLQNQKLDKIGLTLGFIAKFGDKKSLLKATNLEIPG